MRPLIKWAGGKSSEIQYIEKIIPKYERYFEPFVGGGALYFDLEPQKAYVNDITTELIDFYKYIQNGKREQFKEELQKYVKYWHRIKNYMDKFGNTILDIYNKYKLNKISETQFEEQIDRLFVQNIIPFNGLFSNEFAIDKEELRKSIQRNLIEKLNRIKNVVDTQNHFTDKGLLDNIETAFRSGFYMHFREIMNKNKRKELKLTKEKQIANYYFVREFCYGGMFRFNSKGDFNIPYGGIAYNKKNFAGKVNHLFSEPVRRLLKRTIIENMDFEKFLNKHKPIRRDFLFLDPPYDTEFSEYEENPFTQKDQERLAKVLHKTKAQFIVIIKETDFIRGLYENDNNIHIESFDKTYSYNIRGRNEREVKHLIIHNLRETQQKLV